MVGSIEAMKSPWRVGLSSWHSWGIQSRGGLMLREQLGPCMIEDRVGPATVVMGAPTSSPPRSQVAPAKPRRPRHLKADLALSHAGRDYGRACLWSQVAALLRIHATRLWPASRLIRCCHQLRALTPAATNTSRCASSDAARTPHLLSYFCEPAPLSRPSTNSSTCSSASCLRPPWAGSR